MADFLVVNVVVRGGKGVKLKIGVTVMSSMEHSCLFSKRVYSQWKPVFDRVGEHNNHNLDNLPHLLYFLLASYEKTLEIIFLKIKGITYFYIKLGRKSILKR